MSRGRSVLRDGDGRGKTRGHFERKATGNNAGFHERSITFQLPMQIPRGAKPDAAGKLTSRRRKSFGKRGSLGAPALLRAENRASPAGARARPGAEGVECKGARHSEVPVIESVFAGDEARGAKGISRGPR